MPSTERSCNQILTTTSGKDLLTTQKDGRQSGKTFDLGDRTMAKRKDAWHVRQSADESNGFAAHDSGIFIATSQNKEKGSQDLRERREDNRSIKSDNMKMNSVRNKDKENVQRKFNCCGKVFDTFQRLRIHQGKVCKRNVSQQRRSVGHKTCSSNPQDTNHSGEQSIVENSKPGKEYGNKKSKINWPKANDTASYGRFDDEVNKIESKCKGSTEEKLEKLAEVIYEEGKERYGLEKKYNMKDVTIKKQSRDIQLIVEC